MRRLPILMAGLLALRPCFGQTNTEAPLTIERAFEMALERNEEARLADLAVKQRALLPWRSLSLLFPSLTADASRMIPEDEIVGESGSPVVADPTDRASLRLSQPLFSSDAYAGYRSGRSLERAAIEDRVFRLRDLLFRVAATFIDCLKLEHVVGINRETLTLAEEQRRTAEARYEAGEVPKTDVLRAEVEVSRARRELDVSRNQWQLAGAQLATLIGAGDGPVSVQAPPEGLADRLEHADSLETLIAAALEQRDDLRRAAYEREAARWSLVKARRGWWPTVSFDVEQTWADPGSLSQPDDFWTATFRASLPLFEGGARQLDAREARYALEEADLVVSQLVKTVRLQVTEAWLRTRTARVLLDATQKELELARENYDVVSQRYRAGKATSLDQVDAFTQLSRARTSVANLTYDHQAAILHLLRQVGSLGERYVADTRSEPDRSARGRTE
ncbi:MAG TPA: TolC family protein [Kiritimatiellia bacterium]|nr:TolC family protein [Kiritimatiellia bacterium]HRZ13202.1 TolC family protein [Kiritimatiellia bacterium]HSA19720.1 TolC family protein [Kiritimatiellia bacterium]